MAKKLKKKNVKATTLDDLLDNLNHEGVHRGDELVRSEKISTGSLNLDKALEGGFVKGTSIECYGKQSTGKTTLALSLLSQCQGLMGFVDGESAYEKETAEMYGVDVSRLAVKKPAHIEDGMEAVIRLAEAGVDVVVFDSIAGIPTKTELEGSMEDHNVGKKASRMGQLMRKVHPIAYDNETILFFINQVRDSMAMFGPTLTTPGGHALKFHSSYRLWIRGVESIKVGQESIGHYMKIRIEKNKFGKPNIDVKVPLIYSVGISPEREIMDMALEVGILKKSGSWIKDREGNTICQGEGDLFTLLMDNPEFLQELREELKV